MPTNTPAWLTVKNASFKIGPKGFTPPPEDRIVVKNHAVAINASSKSGEVSHASSPATGLLPQVIRRLKRQRVRRRFSDLLAHGANLTSQIPINLPYKDACVIPLGLSTGACGFFLKDYLALQHPTVPPKSTGETLVTWGGSTSVGSNAIQFTVAASYDFIATAS
ncbi:hypothetical protein MMC21_001425 [Puttea exsequens]|nr:hypothetical protein [Puttea exsequens]